MPLFKYLIKIFVKVEFDICGVWAEGGGVGSVTLRTTNQELKLKAQLISKAFFRKNRWNMFFSNIPNWTQNMTEVNAFFQRALGAVLSQDFVQLNQG